MPQEVKPQEVKPAEASPTSKDAVAAARDKTAAAAREANLKKPILGRDEPVSSEAGIENAFDAVGKTSETEVTVPKEKSKEVSKEAPPAGFTLPEMTEEAFGIMQQRAEAMQILEAHDDILRVVAEELKIRQGQVPGSTETETQTETEELGTLRAEVRELKNLLGTVVERVVTNEKAATVENWSELSPIVDTIRKEIPGLSIEQATSFAKDRLAAQGGGQPGGAKPLQTSESATSAAPKGDADKSIDQMKQEAALEVLKPKSTKDAVGIAFQRAIEIAKIQEAQKGA